MADPRELPSIGQLISEWLGVQLPSIPMPQTRKNLDKALGKVVLAAGENLETRIRGNTGKTKARATINVDGMFRTEEERRKLENRASAAKAALDDVQTNPGSADAKVEIEDDWLNLFARLAEDKSSDELRRLFGKILAGEIRNLAHFPFEQFNCSQQYLRAKPRWYHASCPMRSWLKLCRPRKTLDHQSPIAF
jgi:hypothetical protein